MKKLILTILIASLIAPAYCEEKIDNSCYTREEYKKRIKYHNRNGKIQFNDKLPQEKESIYLTYIEGEDIYTSCYPKEINDLMLSLGIHNTTQHRAACEDSSISNKQKRVLKCNS